MVQARAFVAVGIGVLAGSVAGVLAAQTPGSPTFEVASLKPNKSGPNSGQRAGLQAGDRVTMINVPLLTLTQIAYPGMSAIIGGPKWMGSPGPNFDADRFDVNAKRTSPVMSGPFTNCGWHKAMNL
jgi:hypothetical protein